ncbi:MAG: metallophosphoesterase family protein [Candidatus Izemoplasmataceae bacterium]
MIRFIHLSDVHIGLGFQSASFSESLASKRAFEIKQTFFRALHYAKNEDIDFVIISGDLFEHEQVKKQELEEIVKMFKETNKDIFMITGNHDPLKNQSFWHELEFSENVHIFDQELSSFYFKKYNLDIYAHSWSKYYYQDNPLSNVTPKNKNRLNILIAHGDAYTKKTNYLPIDINQFQEFDYVALGHIHKHDFLKQNIAYAGSLEPLSFKETGAHGFVEVAFDNKTFQAKFVPFSKREFEVHKIKVTPEDTLFTITEKIILIAPQHRKDQNLFRVSLIGTTKLGLNLNIKDLLHQITSEFFYIELLDETKIDINVEAIKKQYNDHIIGKYIEKFQQLDLSDSTTYRAFIIGLEALLKQKEGDL